MPRRSNAPSLHHRASSTLHYQTFPTAPPRNAGPPPQKAQMKSNGAPDGPPSPPPSHSGSPDSHQSHSQTPLPLRQLAILAFIALAEQTALNSISPYLPNMAASFPEVQEGNVGLYVGLIASAFALAQFATGFLWGWLSDRIGRKPVVLVGTLLTAACFFAFGFCRTLWQAIVVQAVMGLVNGNQGVISTCLGEITDRSNQSRAFAYLPVIYGMGGITGPLLGGLMVFKEDPFRKGQANPYPYLWPNIASSAILLVDFVLTTIFMEESLDVSEDLPPLKRRIESLFSWLWQFTSSHRPTYLRRAGKTAENHYRPIPQSTVIEDDDEEEVGDDDDDEEEEGADGDTVVDTTSFLRINNETIDKSQIFHRDTILLLITYTIFQLSNIGYNSLYPIFSEASPPTGRGLNPEEVGTSLAFAGLVTIVFQVGIFGWLRDKMGNKATYRACLFLFIIAFFAMPFVGYKSAGKGWLWAELGVILVIKTVASVGGLTSALLLVTNSAPSNAVLGTLNGVAQTLSAAGRAIGPFISGALFSAATHVRPKGEMVAFGIFGGVAFVGFVLSFGIRSSKLESDIVEEEQEDSEEENVGREATSPTHERS